METKHQLMHDGVERGMDLFMIWRHELLCTTTQVSFWRQIRNRPSPLTSSVVWQMMARFRNFYSL